MKKLFILIFSIMSAQIIQAHNLFDQLKPAVATEITRTTIPHCATFTFKNHTYHFGAARALKYIFLMCYTDKKNRKDDGFPPAELSICKGRDTINKAPSALKVLSAAIATDFLCTNYTQPFVDAKMKDSHWLTKHAVKAAARIAVYNVVRNGQECTSAAFKRSPFKVKLYIPILAFES